MGRETITRIKGVLVGAVVTAVLFVFAGGSPAQASDRFEILALDSNPQLKLVLAWPSSHVSEAKAESLRRFLLQVGQTFLASEAIAEFFERSSESAEMGLSASHVLIKFVVPDAHEYQANYPFWVRVRHIRAGEEPSLSEWSPDVLVREVFIYLPPLNHEGLNYNGTGNGGVGWGIDSDQPFILNVDRVSWWLERLLNQSIAEDFEVGILDSDGSAIIGSLSTWQFGFAVDQLTQAQRDKKLLGRSSMPTEGYQRRSRLQLVLAEKSLTMTRHLQRKSLLLPWHLSRDQWGNILAVNDVLRQLPSGVANLYPGSSCLQLSNEDFLSSLDSTLVDLDSMLKTLRSEGGRSVDWQNIFGKFECR